MKLILKRRLTESVTIAPSTGIDGHGYHVYGSGTVYKSLLVDKNKLIRNTEGQEVVSSSRVYVESGWSSPDITDKITLADSSIPTIININTIKNHRNIINHHVAFLE